MLMAYSSVYIVGEVLDSRDWRGLIELEVRFLGDLLGHELGNALYIDLRDGFASALQHPRQILVFSSLSNTRRFSSPETSCSFAPEHWLSTPLVEGLDTGV